MSSGSLGSSGAMEIPAGPSCPACGARARRGAARFCATCGRGLDDGGYVPADSLRASYRFGRGHGARRVAVVEKGRGGRAGEGRRASIAASSTLDDGAARTALAFATYALVPYLGILFCPGAVVLGGVAYVRARRAPQAGGRRAALFNVGLGLVLLAAQLFLWWLLYKVPEWSRGG